MTEQKHPAFVNRLLELKDDRAALATLRRGLGKPPNKAIVAMAPLLERSVPNDVSWPERQCYYLVAALFATHPQQRTKRPLGRAFRAACQESGSSSLERRFQAVLDAEPEDLGVHLRHLVSLLASKEQGLDWGLLLSDCRHWSHPERFVQARWARDFWGVPSDDEEEEEEASPPVPVVAL